MVFIEEAAKELVNPLKNLWEGFVSVFPGLIAAIIILILGYFVAVIIGHIIKVVLSKLRVDNGFAKLELPKSIGKIKISLIIGELSKWYIFIIFLQAAVSAVNLGSLSMLLNRFVIWLPNLIVAVIAMLIGLFVAHYISHLVLREAKMKGMKFVSQFLYLLIIFLSLVIALEQIGIQVEIIKYTFLILLASLGLGTALAIGLSLGLGLKGHASSMLDKLKKSF